MRSDQEIKKLRTNLNSQIDELEILINRKSETFMNIEAPVFWNHLPNEINILRNEIKFLRKEVNVLEGQIKLIDWLLGKSNEIL
jgi:hypothetical protein